MTQPKRHHLFISHAWEHNDDYYRLVEMLNKADGFDWHNYSVPEHNPKHANNEASLREALRNQMQPTNSVIIISGMYVAYREWIQYEIDMATQWKKPIIGIRPRGSERIPTAVSSVAKEMVGWYTPSIVAAIRKHQPGFQCESCKQPITRQDRFCPSCYRDLKWPK